MLALVRPSPSRSRVHAASWCRGGALVICHFDWLPLPGNVVAATEALILEHNPEWPLSGGLGMYPLWTLDVAEAGFTGLETFSFDVPVAYSHEAWRGRIRASAGVAASLPPDAVAAFDDELARPPATGLPERASGRPPPRVGARGAHPGAATSRHAANRLAPRHPSGLLPRVPTPADTHTGRRRGRRHGRDGR